jgi:hypothetical protein
MRTEILATTESLAAMGVDLDAGSALGLLGLQLAKRSDDPITHMENARDLVDRIEWSVDNMHGIMAAFDDKLDDISPEFEQSIVNDGIQVPVFVQEDYPARNYDTGECIGRVCTLRNGHHRLLVAWIYNLDVPVAEYDPTHMQNAECSRRDLPSGWPDNGGWREQ